MQLVNRYKIAASVIAICFVISSSIIGVSAKALPTNDENEKGRVIGATVTSAIFESPNDDSAVLNVVVRNQIVRSLDECGDFYQIRYGREMAFVKKEDFLEGTDLLRYVRSHPEWYTRWVKIAAEDVNLMDCENGKVVATAKMGDMFQLKYAEKNFYVAILPVAGDDGMADSTLVRISKDESIEKCLIDVTNFEGMGKFNEGQTDIISFACEFVGYPYVWGGTDPLTGADCSGFVQYVYRNFGIELPRCSWQQAEVGKEVSFEALEPGDLIFYQRGERIGHVALYIGDGKVVHARGKEYGICITRYDYSKPAYARRII